MNDEEAVKIPPQIKFTLKIYEKEAKISRELKLDTETLGQFGDAPLPDAQFELRRILRRMWPSISDAMLLVNGVNFAEYMELVYTFVDLKLINIDYNNFAYDQLGMRMATLNFYRKQHLIAVERGIELFPNREITIDVESYQVRYRLGWKGAEMRERYQRLITEQQKLVIARYRALISEYDPTLVTDPWHNTMEPKVVSVDAPEKPVEPAASTANSGSVSFVETCDIQQQLPNGEQLVPFEFPDGVHYLVIHKNTDIELLRALLKALTENEKVVGRIMTPERFSRAVQIVECIDRKMKRPDIEKYLYYPKMQASEDVKLVHNLMKM